ncbi:putative Alpha-(1,6)-fucosyltransferase [Hypsibius exemplaris]|uniref:Alpha-(1,6)-fucosyltransferase n=1 Tax=Hypsibius exemplaris TaxID=2072580 RepID=A0A1W0X2Z0_HYPEX|nr:putative Alpha-(1,6)-fucosyltransferase [Hypsibius exemplaris]
MDREDCGLGCQLHYGVTCIAASFALNRTTILRLGNWIYTKGLTNRWEDYFVPPSPKCQWTPYSEPLTVWRNASHNALNTVLYPLDVFNVQYFKPFRVAESFADRLRHFHGRPWIWWIGQLLVNLFRVQTDFEDLFAKRAKAIGFKSPIVGVHVRRSDKTASEARAYDLEAYMALVEEYYDRLELTQKVDQRRVFLASDAPSVYVEFRMKYPQYALVHNQAAAKSSARKETRRSEDSLRGIMADMYFLAKTDHLVCTMSSNMGSNPLYHKAVHPNEAGVNGISLGFNVGDRIRVKDTHWNGTSYGLIVQQNGSWVEDKGQRGSFPAYKLQEDLEVF